MEARHLSSEGIKVRPEGAEARVEALGELVELAAEELVGRRARRERRRLALVLSGCRSGVTIRLTKIRRLVGASVQHGSWRRVDGRADPAAADPIGEQCGATVAAVCAGWVPA